MKKLKKVLSGALAVAMLASSMTLVSLAATTDPYEKNGDFATNGEFPKEGTILDWTFYAQPEGMKNCWANLSNLGIIHDKYKWADDSDRDNSYFHFDINGKTNDGADIWSGASTIKTGVLQIDANVYVPELKNPDKETYGQIFAIWGKDDAGTFYAEQGALYSVIMNDDKQLYVGFNTRDHHEPATNPGDENAHTVAIDAAKWYKLSAVINYDAKTLDYYLNDEYVCSHRNFAENSYYYEMGSLYYSKHGSPATNDTHVYVTGLKMTRRPTTLTAAATIKSANTVNVEFNEAIRNDQIANDTFEVKNAAGESYTVTSAVLSDEKNAVITIDGTFAASEIITVVAKKDITAKTAINMASESSFTALPLPPNDAFVDLDFESTAFPADFGPSKSFTDFYCEYPAYTGHILYDSDFVNSKELLDVASDSYYMGYNWRYFSQINAENGSGKALKFHRDSADQSAKYWSSTNRTIGLVIPFNEGKSVSGGKLEIEFDAGKTGTTNSDLYTIGLHDKNNEIRKFDINNAISNSTALFTFGDYYETDTIIYAPRGRSAGYSYYFGQSNPTDKLLWPSGWQTQQRNNAVRHYKVELNLDTKQYNVYQDGTLIGDALTLPSTDNAPCYDAFVIGSGLDTRAEMENLNHGFYLDNLTIINPEEESLKVVSVKNADGTNYTGKLVDNKVVFNFNKAIASANVTVGAKAVTPTIEGSNISVSLDGIDIVGNTTITLTNITAADGKVIEELKTLAMLPKVSISGAFSETPDGYVLTLNDGAYKGAYNVYVVCLDKNDRLLAVDVFDKNELGIYTLSENFKTAYESASAIKGFVWGDNLTPLTEPITPVK